MTQPCVEEIFIGLAIVAHADFEARDTPTKYKNIKYYSMVNPGICSFEQGNIFNDHKKLLYNFISRKCMSPTFSPEKYNRFISNGFNKIREEYLQELLVATPRCREIHRAITMHTTELFHHNINHFKKGLVFLEKDKLEHSNGVYVTCLLLKIDGKWNTVPDYFPPEYDRCKEEFDSSSEFNLVHSKNRAKLAAILNKFGVKVSKKPTTRIYKRDTDLQEFIEFLQCFNKKCTVNILDLSCNNPAGHDKAIPAVEHIRLTKKFIPCKK